MRTNLKAVSITLCALAMAAHAQTTPSKSAATTKAPNALSFHYDAQNNEVVANGIQLKPVSAATTAPTTGTFVVTINIGLVTQTFHSGTTYQCSLTVVGGEIDTTNDEVAGGIETATATSRGTAPNMRTCTLTIPYSWALQSSPTASQGAILAFGVSAVAPAAYNNIVQRSTMQVDGVESLPASGATSTYTFNVTL